MIIRFLYTQLYRAATGEVHRLEYDAAAQYNFHRIAAFFWLFCMIAVPFDKSFAASITALLIMEASLYANFTTDFGAMSAAMAADQEHRGGSAGENKPPTAQINRQKRPSDPPL